jgi:8-oxo-dGTP pyrophosphatase MutT (NUDIX family)
MKYHRKAYGCITRGDYVLVFREIKGDIVDDIQFPGGTIEDGESIEAGLLREVEEESGLSDLKIVRLLGCDMWEAALGHIAMRHFYQMTCAEEMPDTWRHYENFSSEHDHPLLYEFIWIPISEAKKGMLGEHHRFVHVIGASNIAS